MFAKQDFYRSLLERLEGLKVARKLLYQSAMIAKLKYLIWLTIFLITSPNYLKGGVMTVSATQRFPATAFDTLRIAQDEGKITVTGTDVQEITVTYTRREGGEKCGPQFINAGSTFRIVARDTSSGPKEECAVDMQIQMPKRFNLRAGIAAADLTLQGVRGNLRLEIGAGLVTGLIASPRTDIELASGSIKLEWNPLPNPGTVFFEAAAGTVQLTLPRGSAADVQVKRALVPATIDVPQRADAPFKIRGKMAFGSFTVRQK